MKAIGGSVVGIDLSGLSRATKGRTAAARVALGPELRLVDLATFRPGLARDRDLVNWIVGDIPRVVAIDAPLSLPHSVMCALDGCPRCEPGSAEYLQRDIDRPAGGMPTVMLAAIMFRGIYLARLLRGLGIEVIETYPAAAYRAWGVARGDTASMLQAVASRIGVFQPGSPDERDAVTAAVAAADHAMGESTRFHGEDGDIWLPMAAALGKPT